MAVDEREALRAELRKIIGRDYLYVQAKDEQRHFDPITLATAYAGALFLAFVTGAATTIGETTAKDVWRRVSALLSGAEPTEASDSTAQLLQIGKADQALKALAAALSEDYLRTFIEAGRGCVEQRLCSNNFPEAKAKHISTKFAEFVERRMKGGKA